MSAPSSCPVRVVCLSPGPCAANHGCILQAAPLILTPMSDWRADPYPYALRADSKPRAVFPQGVA